MSAQDGEKSEIFPQNMISEKCEGLKILKMALKIRKSENREALVHQNVKTGT